MQVRLIPPSFMATLCVRVFPQWPVAPSISKAILEVYQDQLRPAAPGCGATDDGCGAPPLHLKVAQVLLPLPSLLPPQPQQQRSIAARSASSPHLLVSPPLQAGDSGSHERSREVPQQVQ